MNTQLIDTRGRPLSSNGDGGFDLRHAHRIRREVVNALGDVLRDRVRQLSGKQYENSRDVYKVAGYPKEYSFEEGWDRYQRQGLAKRIVDLPVSKTWRHKPDLLVGDDGESELATTFDDLWDHLSLGARFSQADRMASIGEFSVLLIGFTGADADQQLKEPVADADVSEPADVLYVKAYKQSDVEIARLEDDHQTPRYGHPLMYKVDLSGGETRAKRGGGGVGTGKTEVHWSRVIHIVEDPLDSDVYGLPRLQSVLNRLIDIEKLAASGAEAFWQNVVRILNVSVDPEASLSDSEWTDLKDMLEDLAHDLRRHFLGQGIDMDWLSGEVANPSGTADMLMMLAAVSANIPKRILFGTETGERASEQDERAFLGTVAERIEQYAEPTIVRQFIDRLFLVGAIEEPAEGYTLQWKPLFELSELQKAEKNKATAETANSLTQIAGDPRRQVRVNEDREVELLTDAEIEERDGAPPGEGDGEDEEDVEPGEPALPPGAEGDGV